MQPYSVINCHFEFKCPEKWDVMTPTPFSDIRYCGVCQQNVLKCRTEEQLAWAIENNHCCAVEKPVDDNQVEVTIGMPLYP
jgi:hypothetical protein